MIRALIVGMLMWTNLFASSARADILDKKVTVQVWSREFFVLCRAIGVVCGIEIDHALYKARLGPIDLENVSARHALSTVMERYPGHRWELRDGMLLVYPKRRHEPSPLEQRIGRLVIPNQTLSVIRDRFAKEMQLPGLSYSVGGSEVEYEPDNRTISMFTKNATIRDALALVVKTRKDSMWEFRRMIRSDGTPFYALDLDRYDKVQKKPRHSDDPHGP